VGDLGGLGAVCRVCGDNFGHVSRSSAVLGVLVGALGSRDTSHSGDSEGGSETHGGISREVVGLLVLVRLSIKWFVLSSWSCSVEASVWMSVCLWMREERKGVRKAWINWAF
jgi:hypothetical protein